MNAQAAPENAQPAAEQQPQPQQRQHAPPPGALPGSFTFNIMQHFGELPGEEDGAGNAGAAVSAFEELMRRHMQRVHGGAGAPSVVIGNRHAGIMLQISTAGGAMPMNLGM